MSKPIPIAVISCQRPHYLRETLLGLRNSCGHCSEQFNIRLFQDVPPGDKVKSDDIASQCTKTFLSIFPEGSIDLADINVGVAANFRRAEDWAFSPKICCSPINAALFFEEDFVPNETTVSWILAMLELGRRQHSVGAVSAAGHLAVNVNNYIQPMGQLWAYGLRKEAHERVSNKINAYDLLAVEAFKFSGAHHPPIDTCLHLALEWGYEAQAASRDSFIAMALHSEGYIQIAPNGVHGQYIGVNGLNSNKGQFDNSEWSSIPQCNTSPNIEKIEKEFTLISGNLKDHQQRQFKTLNATFYSDSCVVAYQQERYLSCIKIAERGLVLMGSQSCRGFPFCFERNRIKGLVGIGELDMAIDYCEKLISAITGSWPFWVLARSLEEQGWLVQAKHIWEYIVQKFPEDQASGNDELEKLMLLIPK